MIIAAIGYLGFFLHVVLDKNADLLPNQNYLGLNTVVVLCALFLISASMWMPSTLQFIKTGAYFWWVITVGSLWITGLAVIGMLLALSTKPTSKQTITKQSAILGLGYLGFHCLVLDATI